MKITMRVLVMLSVLLVSVSAHAQLKSDLYASVRQELVDKVLGNTSFPFTIVEKSNPFDPKSIISETFSISAADLQLYFTWAEQNPQDESAQELLLNRDRFLGSLEEASESKIDAKKMKAQWAGPTDKELATYKKLGFDVKINVAYVRVFIPTVPGIGLAGPRTDINNLTVGVDVTAELWVKRPKLECAKMCRIGPIKTCCWWKVVWVWEKWASVSVRNFKVNSDATLYAEVDLLILYMRGYFRRLRVDLPVLKEIGIEDIANLVLKDRRFAVMDLTKLVASLPLIEQSYVIDNVTINGTGEVRVDLIIKKK